MVDYMDKVTASAPGKIILFGEHSVVYGKPAIAASIDTRTFIEAERLEEDRIKIEANDIKVPGLTLSFKEDQIFMEADYGKAAEILGYVKKAVDLVLKKTDVDTGISLSISSDIPVGAGLGSSAAVANATIASVSELLGINLTNREIGELGHETELSVQGNSSGIDPMVQAIGGLIYYKDGNFKQIPFRKLPIVLGYTGSKGNTGKLVEEVKKRLEEDPEVMEPVVESMGNLVDQSRESLEGEFDSEKLGRLMNINHGLLSALGVSTKELSDLVYATRSAGALGSKLTGAGGGGCMYAYCPGRCDEVSTAIEVAGGTPISTKIAKEGVRIEKRE